MKNEQLSWDMTYPYYEQYLHGNVDELNVNDSDLYSTGIILPVIFIGLCLVGIIVAICYMVGVTVGYGATKLQKRRQSRNGSFLV